MLLYIIYYFSLYTSQTEDDPVYEEKRESLQIQLNRLHQDFQGRLDYMNKRFQREWMNNPCNKGNRLFLLSWNSLR